MNSQLIIVIAIVILAVAYIVKTMYKSAKGNACESGNCKCDSKIVKKV